MVVKMKPFSTCLANQPTPLTSKHWDWASAMPAGGATPQVISIGGSPYAVVSGLCGEVSRRSASRTLAGSALIRSAQAAATSGAGEGTGTGVGPGPQPATTSTPSTPRA